jgi:MATE family multidrug resistance protein
MEASAKQGLAWERRPLGELLRLSWPITLSTISYSLMTLVDTLLVGRLGAAQLAGVGLGGTAAFALLCFSFGLLRGVKTLVAQAVGAGKRDEIGRYLGAALLAAGAISVISVGLGQLLAELLTRVAATEASGEAARTYLSLRILGAPFALAYVALREVRYAQGDARSPMKATMIANGVNIALAYVMIFHLGWGVTGAGIATVIAHAVELGVLALAQRAYGFQLAGTSRRHLRELWQVGLPTGLQFTLEIGAFAMLAALIAALSEVQMAAHQIALQVIHFSFLPAYAVAEAASVLGGQAVGANRDDLVMRVARIALAVTGVYTAAWTLLLALGSPLIVSGFRPDAALAQVAVKLLYVAAVFQMFDGVNVVLRAVLRGAGDVKFAAWVGVLTSWIFTPPLTWILGYELGMGALGGWLGLSAEIVAGAVVLYWRLEKRSWVPAAVASRARMAAIRADDSRSASGEPVPA